MNKVTKIMSIGMFTNLGLSLLKVVVGIFAKSSALITDGIHSLSDLITDVVAILGNFFASKPADLEHPYGHGRLEYITSTFIGLFILFLGFSLVSGFSTSEVVIPSSIVIIISLFTIIAKKCLSSYIIKKGMELENNILIASGKESFTDVYSSFVVLIASILVQFYKVFSPFMYADKIASIIVSIFIVKTGYDIIKENLSILIGRQESEENVEQIRELLLGEKEIKGIDKLVVLKYGGYYKIILEVSMDGNLSLKTSHDKMEEIENKIIKNIPKAKYIIIHINPYDKI